MTNLYVLHHGGYVRLRGEHHQSQRQVVGDPYVDTKSGSSLDTKGCGHPLAERGQRVGAVFSKDWDIL